MGKRAKIKRERARRRKLLPRLLPVLFAKAACEILPKHFRRDCCINATSTALQVFKHFGLEATPVYVRSIIFNAKAWELVQANDMNIPTDPEVNKSWDEQGAWILQADEKSKTALGGEESGFNGHVVCVVGDYIVDASSGQFTRPHKDIETPFAWSLKIERTTPDAFLAGKDPVTFGNEQGCVIIYSACPERREYVNASGWSNPSNAIPAQALIKRLERMLAKL